jgi:TRAP-type C4-dicarboxylate transport system substrate-binding protein
MPADHFAINLDVYNSLPEDIQRILDVASQKNAFRTTLHYMVDIQNTVRELQGEVTFHDWSEEDRAEFRAGARKAWAEFAEGSEPAEELVKSHVDFMQQIGIDVSDMQ